ncbi:MAG TPA: AAA family ATPase [Oculatellaceae cyanobacterium]
MSHTQALPAPAVHKVEQSTTISLRRLETGTVSRRERKFGEFIDSVIIGQPNGRRAAKRAYRRTLATVRIGHHPYYVIVAPGPTTSGKSELGYRLAEFIHGSRDCIVKVDGSQFMEKHRLSILTGASPDHVGYTNRKERDYVPPLPHEKDAYAEFSQHNLNRSRIGSKTNSPVIVVLIDEWEKGCYEFNNILLSIFRDGKYTLGNGEEVDFSNCIFVLTANIGSAAVEEADSKQSIGFNSKKGITDEEADKIVVDHLRQFAPPEFRARVEENGEVCIFHKLTGDQIGQVCALKVRELVADFEKQAKITLDIDEAARKHLLSKSGSVSKLNGVVQLDILDVLINEMEKDEIKAGSVVHVAHVEGEDELSFSLEIEVKPLILGVTPEMLAQAMAEADEQFSAHSARLTGSDVDVSKVKGDGIVDGSQDAAANAGESVARDGAAGGITNETSAPSVEGIEARALQGFVVAFRCATAEAFAKSRHVILEALKSLPDTVVMKSEETMIEPFIGSFEVASTLDAMHIIKSHIPELTIKIAGGVLE